MQSTYDRAIRFSNFNFEKEKLFQQKQPLKNSKNYFKSEAKEQKIF